MASELLSVPRCDSRSAQPPSSHVNCEGQNGGIGASASNLSFSPVSSPTPFDYVPLQSSPEGVPILKPQNGDENLKDMAPSKTPLGRGVILAYGTGHMLNDLTAACWFTYLLIFLTDVGLTPKEAAVVMMTGQCADGVATLVVGRLIDDFGHFKLWHAAGSLLVAVSFSSVFGGCLVCVLLGTSTNLVRTISYSVFAAIFNCGWAATQVSHMSLVNCITANSTSRVALNSCRNAFTMIANLGLYGIAYLAFWLLPAASQLDVQLQFRWIAAAAIALGLLLVLGFQAGVREPRLQHTSSLDIPRMAWTSWFKQVLYYQVAAIYMLTRLTTNVSQAILPFFLIDDLGMSQSSKASIPALVYLCSFLASLILQELPWSGRRLKLVFAGGALLWVLSGVVFFDVRDTQQSVVYVLTAAVGIGNALMLVTATSMEGVLVANQLSGCAFVYGSLSFLDKLACGLALYAIEGVNVSDHKFCGNPGAADCKRSLVRWVLTLVPGGCALVAAILALCTNLNESHQTEDVSLMESLLPSHAQSGRMSPRRSRKPSPETENRGFGLALAGAVDIPRRRPRRGSEGDGGEDETEPASEAKWSASAPSLLAHSEEGNGGGGEASGAGNHLQLWKLLSDAMVGRWRSKSSTTNDLL